MKQNKLIHALAISGCLIMAPVAAYADRDCDHDRGRHNMAEKFEHMSERLDLTTDQQTQVKAILDKYEDDFDGFEGRKKMRKDMMKLDPSAADYNEQLAQKAQEAADKVKQKIETMGQFRKEMHAVLTEEQRAKMQEMMGRQEKKRRRWFGDD